MICNKCQKQASYSRKYSGETLCSECFSNSILHKAAKTISKYKMIKNNELVCVAVSGGKDSLVLLNIFKIKKKINETVDKIIEFNPDILFSVDSPDFTLRVAKKVKKINSNIKTIHFVAPQVWIWRENRVKHIKSFLDHMLLLFPFEKNILIKKIFNQLLLVIHY